MKSFEKEIKKRLQVQVIKAIIMGLFVVIMFLIKLNIHGNIESVSELDKIILIGFLIGGEVSSIRAILLYRHVLKTSDSLEELHIKENDERNQMIIRKTCQSTVGILCVLLSIMGIVMSFFNMTVLMTIGIILIVILMLYCSLRWFYDKKYS